MPVESRQFRIIAEGVQIARLAGLVPEFNLPAPVAHDQGMEGQQAAHAAVAVQAGGLPGDGRFVGQARLIVGQGCVAGIYIGKGAAQKIRH